MGAILACVIICEWELGWGIYELGWEMGDGRWAVLRRVYRRV